MFLSSRIPTAIASRHGAMHNHRREALSFFFDCNGGYGWPTAERVNSDRFNRIFHRWSRKFTHISFLWIRHFLLVNPAKYWFILAQPPCLDGQYSSVQATAPPKDSSTINSANRLQSNLPAFSHSGLITDHISSSQIVRNALSGSFFILTQSQYKQGRRKWVQQQR